MGTLCSVKDSDGRLSPGIPMPPGALAEREPAIFDESA
jgi:hypothetical protein